MYKFEVYVNYTSKNIKLHSCTQPLVKKMQRRKESFDANSN